MNNADWEEWERQERIRLIRWYNLAYEPAVLKLAEKQGLSKYVVNKMLEPYKHLKRKRVPKQDDSRFQ